MLRAFAEHIRLPLCPDCLASRKIVIRRAGAPAGTREGACAPQIQLNRSALVKVGAVGTCIRKSVICRANLPPTVVAQVSEPVMSQIRIGRRGKRNSAF